MVEPALRLPSMRPRIARGLQRGNLVAFRGQDCRIAVTLRLRKPRRLVTVVAGGSNSRRIWFREPDVDSAAATDIKLAIDGGVLRTELLEMAGGLRGDVRRVRLAVADWRAADRSRLLRQR